MDYRDYNDYELVYEIRENSEDAYNLLIEKYRPLIIKTAKEYRNNFKGLKLEIDDLAQEGFCGLLQALDNYDEKSCLFYTYAILCIHREMERLIKSISRNKKMALNGAISISSPIMPSSELTLEDIIADKDTVESLVIDKLNCDNLLSLKYDMPFEMSLVFELKSNRFTNREISQLLDIPMKRVQKHLYKIKRIIKSKYNRIY